MITSINKWRKINESKSFGFRDYDNSVQAKKWLQEYIIQVFPQVDVYVQMSADDDFIFSTVTLDQDTFNSWIANYDENIYNFKNAAYEFFVYFFVDAFVNFNDTNFTITYSLSH